ncbi:hypothetical protein EYF80_029142 [Liparis tanakae]|uniref:Uncharacterized protein n=1 Tax=Liparis tanakae TaxID=230148 RepID=A0A4Z2H4I3_9TELE|nr:hypothetical protein EYF80_029142 [Liparis tanakae]
MEGTHTAVNLYVPVSERIYVSPSLSRCRGPASPYEAPLKPQGGRTSKEEGPAGAAEKKGQADKRVLSDVKESLEVSDGFCPTEWSPSCSECQTSMSMGSHQSTKSKQNLESRGALPKPPRLQIPRKRRRRAEGLIRHDLRTTPGGQRASGPTKLRTTGSPTSGVWGVEEDGPTVRTSGAQRKRVVGKERVPRLEERNRSQRELKATWSVKLPDALSAEDFSAKEERALPDSDLSEYDNDVDSADIFLAGKTEDSRNAEKAEIFEAAEGVEEKSSQWRYEEKAAAQRVMGKIEEVEGIIRRVSVTSSDWIKEGSDARFVSDGCFGENERCDEDEPLLVEELQALGEALRQSLRQVLKMEAAEAEGEPFTKTVNTYYKPKPRRPLNPSSYPHRFASTEPDNSSPSRSPSPSLSELLDLSPRASGSFEDTSPIPSPWSERRGGDTREPHMWGGCSAEGGVFPQEAADCDGRGGDQKKSRKRRQNQIQTCSETETSQDDLLSSDEVLRRQENIWQQEVEESLSFCRSLSHPSRPKHIDFLRITAPEDDIIDTPTSTPSPPALRGVATHSGFKSPSASSLHHNNPTHGVRDAAPVDRRSRMEKEEAELGEPGLGSDFSLWLSQRHSHAAGAWKVSFFHYCVDSSPVILVAPSN